MISVREIAFGSGEYQRVLKLRSRILREPLGLQFTAAELEADRNDVHLALFKDKELVACLIFTRKSPELLKMRQVAVDQEFQGQGFGRSLVRFAEEWARKNLFVQIELHARETATAFYLALGYSLSAEPFVEVGLPHRKMIKPLDSRF